MLTFGSFRPLFTFTQALLKLIELKTKLALKVQRFGPGTDREDFVLLTRTANVGSKSGSSHFLRSEKPVLRPRGIIAATAAAAAQTQRRGSSYTSATTSSGNLNTSPRRSSSAMPRPRISGNVTSRSETTTTATARSPEPRARPFAAGTTTGPVYSATIVKQAGSTGLTITGSVDSVMGATFTRKVEPDSPAHAAGVGAGDRILEVNGMSVLAMNSNDCKALFCHEGERIHCDSRHSAL